MRSRKDFGVANGVDGLWLDRGLRRHPVPPVGGAEPGKVGWLRPDFEARLVDEHDMDVAPGTPGELLVRSKEPWLIMDGYHDMPQATVDVWRNLWFHTGD